MTSPLVTVLMPVYNASAFLAEAIESILNQTYKDFIFIIINDGSTDNSENIILGFNDSRIKYYCNSENLGLVKTLNKGLSLIETPYLARMDADDISLPDRLRFQMEYLLSNPEIGVCGCFIRVFGKQNAVWTYPEYSSNIKASIFFRNLSPHSASVIKTALFKDNSIEYRSIHPHIEDRDLWFRFLFLTEFHNLQMELYDYRILDHNVTQLNKDTLLTRTIDFYSDLYQKIGFITNKDELRIIYDHGKTIKLTPKNLSLINNFFKRLIIFNDETGYFSSMALKEQIQIYWKKLIYRSMKAGFRSGSKYLILSRIYNPVTWGLMLKKSISK